MSKLDAAWEELFKKYNIKEEVEKNGFYISKFFHNNILRRLPLFFSSIFRAFLYWGNFLYSNLI